MPSLESHTIASQVKLVQSVDDGRAAADPFKLPASLRSQVDLNGAALGATDAAALKTESVRTGKSGEARDVLARILGLLRDGYRGIRGLRSDVIPDWLRMEVFAAYGWTGGLLGTFSHPRILSLARTGVADHSQINPAFRYPDELVAELSKALTLYDGLEADANTGPREAAIQERNLKLKAAETTLSRVRFFYCSASDDTDCTKELSKIGFQPRRARRSPEVVAEEAKKRQERRDERLAKKQQREEDKQTKIANRHNRAAQNALSKVFPAAAAGNVEGGTSPRPSASAPQTPIAAAGDVELSA